MSEQGLDRIARRRQVVAVDGRNVEVAALTVGDYAEARQQALAAYRRDQVKAWVDASEYLPSEERTQILRDAVAKAAAITVDALPLKRMKILAPGDSEPKEREVDYGMWWASETLEGKLFCCWLSMRACPGQEYMTISDVDLMLSQNLNDLGSLTQAIVDVSSPRPRPNSLGRREEIAEARRRKREERRRRQAGR